MSNAPLLERGAVGSKVRTNILQEVGYAIGPALNAGYARLATGQNIRSMKGENQLWQTE